MTTRIIQISDLHVGDGWSKTNENANLKKIVQAIAKTYGAENDKPVVLITGDVTDSGTDGQLEAARETLDGLYNSGFVVWPIPGNHDYGIKGMIDDKDRIKAFKGTFFNHEQWIRQHETVSYPHIIPINGHYFIGLDSMKADVETPDLVSATGRLGPKQLKTLAERMDGLDVSADRKIILFLHHHPFLFYDDVDSAKEIIKRVWDMLHENAGHKLVDGEALMETIRDRAAVLLFGHDHDHVNFAGSEIVNRYRIPLILSCGKSTSPALEYRATPKGLIDNEKPVRKTKHLLGWHIELPDDGPPEARSIAFMNTGCKLL